MTRPSSKTWRNRIVGHANVAPVDLVPNPLNWRSHPADQQRALGGALAEVGWVSEVIVNQTTGRLVDGHLRVELAIKGGEASIPVTYVTLTEEEERLVLASLDPIAAMATAEEAQLASLLAVLQPSEEALKALLDDLAREHHLDDVNAGIVDGDDVPALPDEPDVSLGDLYQLGDHRLLCGDSTSESDVARLFGHECAECLWTDPPYGVDYEGKTDRHLRIRNDDPDTSDDVVGGAFRLAPLAPSTPFYVSAPAGPRSASFRAAIASAGWRLHQELVWVKGTIVLGHSDYHYAHEPILYGFVPGSGRPGRGRHEGTHWYGDDSQSSVLEYQKPAANREHPTAKPVGLIAHCLRNSTRPGDLVYEPFAGSGSTMIAADQLGRRCYAIEIDPRYAQVTIERWQRYSGQTGVKIDG
jgi:DNA modification methylase